MPARRGREGGEGEGRRERERERGEGAGRGKEGGGGWESYERKGSHSFAFLFPLVTLLLSTH